MGTKVGAAFNRDGLVFHYDMDINGNAGRSWKGTPTVNLISNAGADAEIERSGTSYPYFSRNITSYVLANWSASNNKLSMSFEGKRDYSVGGTGSGGDGYPRMYIYFTDWSWASSFGGGSYDWTYFKQNNITMPNPTGKTIYFAIYHMHSGNPGRSYSRNHQVEFGTFATPFVNGTRSSTDALLDSTGNYTLTINSLVYNSNGTFSFGGSHNIDLNSQNIISGTNPFTIESWTNLTSGNYGAIFGNYGTGYSTGLWWATAGLYITGSVYHSNYATTMAGKHHSAVTRDSSGNVRLYRDGVLVNTGTLTASVPSNVNFRIGTDTGGTSEAMNGDIYSVKVYNRVLSAEEVKQNFNANKKRFGL